MKKRSRHLTACLKQKLPSALSHQDKCLSAIANYFLCFTSFPAFEIFRSGPFTQMTHDISGEKEIRVLTIKHLKMLVNKEWNTFIKKSERSV